MNAHGLALPRFPIETGELPPGLYLIWMESEEGRAIERAVLR